MRAIQRELGREVCVGEALDGYERYLLTIGFRATLVKTTRHRLNAWFDNMDEPLRKITLERARKLY